MLTPPRRALRAEPLTRVRRSNARTALTALYTAAFLASGVGLVAVMGGLIVHSTSSVAAAPTGACAANRLEAAAVPVGAVNPPPCGSIHGAGSRNSGRSERLRPPGRGFGVSQVVTDAGITLAVLTVIAAWMGWVISGRVLRPIRAMSALTRSISASNLHERLAMRGPEDEVKDLADAIDALLGRLEDAFDAQRRFIANAAHELTTPLAVERAVMEVALADPDASAASLRDACREVLAANDEQARLIEALLTLATGDRGLDRCNPIDLAPMADRVLELRRPVAQEHGVRVRSDIAPAPTLGDAELAERLIANLVDNAIRHNVADGWIEVRTAEAEGGAVLVVRNSGPVVPASEVARLMLPFQRMHGERTAGGSGHGLGLSIVKAIAAAHGAAITVAPGPEGGMDVEVRFPRPKSRPHDPSATAGGAIHGRPRPATL